MANRPWKWQNTRENKITKHAEKQNDSTYYLWYLPKKRPLYLWVSRGKESFYHVKRTIFNRNYINLTHYTINLFRTWNPTPLHRSSNLFQSNFVNYILCSYEKLSVKILKIPLRLFLEIPASCSCLQLPSLPNTTTSSYLGYLAWGLSLTLLKGNSWEIYPNFFYFFFKLFIAHRNL